LVKIRWYWAEPGAPYYPFGHCFEPVLYFEDKLPLYDSVGEIPGATRNYYNGHRPPGHHATGAWCGTEADFLGQGRQPLKPSGKVDFSKLCGCAYQPKIGFHVRSSMQHHFNPPSHVAFDAAGCCCSTGTFP
jgi:hypothetical protein